MNFQFIHTRKYPSRQVLFRFLLTFNKHFQGLKNKITLHVTDHR